MTDKVSERAVADFVARELGCEPTRIARRDAFVTNAVFDVEADGRQLVVKASCLHDALRAEAWACSQGAGAGCGAPEILAFGRLEISDALSAFVMPRLGGDPIVPGHPAWPEVGARIRRLHAVKLPGYGTLANAQEDGRGGYRLSHDSWTGYLGSICVDTRRLANGSAQANNVAGALGAALDAHSPDLAAVHTGSLCHGDLKVSHILVDGERLSGVIDWGDAVVADPLWDIARFAHRTDAGLTAAFVAGYDPEGTLAGDLAWRLPLYGALWMLVDAIVDDRLGQDVGGLLDSAMSSLASLREH